MSRGFYGIKLEIWIMHPKSDLACNSSCKRPVQVLKLRIQIALKLNQYAAAGLVSMGTFLIMSAIIMYN
ncbi:MAG: hypothetical protein K0Q73_6591 [Paenibacillus sp.]|jgi:hypothetical protein|nr:hypothetical protein [Paenibacillus sp.]